MDRRISSLIDQKGQVMLVLIAGFVIAAGVGAGMVYLGGTSTYSELLTNNASKAEALAESGGRVAIPWVKRNLADALANLHDKTFALGDGTFTIRIVDNSPPNFTTIQSTGVVSTDTFLETRRLISYLVPKGLGSPPLYENQDWTDDAMDIDSNRQDGEFEIATVDGDSALHVTDVATGSYKQDAVAGFAPASASSPDFQGIWQTGENLLSYRAQVKILDLADPPDDFYMAGISFRVSRLDSLTGSLGVSLFRSYRGGQGTYAIPDSLVPQLCPWVLCPYLDYAAILLLWTQTNEGSGGRVPLAYHILDLNWFYIYFSNDLYVVDTNDHLRPWVTLLVSVEEKQLETGRVNDIKVYVGNVQTDHGANDTPLDPGPSDAERLKHDRGQIEWPPVDVNQTTTTNDLFTLVQWTAVDSRVQVIPGSGKEQNAVIRTGLATTSPDSYVDRPEIALVAFGTRTNARHLYFDDFAVDFPFGGSGSGFVQY